jgi:hypothetical protein
MVVRAGWDRICSSAGGRRRSDEREAMNREKEWKNVEDTLSRI